MGFGQAIAACFRNYATFRGRARRAEYWFFVLFAILAAIAAGVFDTLVLHAKDGGPASSILTLALFLPQLAVTVRRLHDRGHSGWWLGGFYIVIAIALMGSIMAVFGPAGRGPVGNEGEIVPTVLMGGAALYGVWMFVLLVLRGTGGSNKYGPDPLAP